ncbi:unnamed protein product [Vicia faba]|uniref:Uncharacterized protein n=1 Tax=Vicia faba TaxID=3906 RepID=A0AAV0ZAR2_VICFA|nr:unnamed protein product [Vicia faba]
MDFSEESLARTGEGNSELNHQVDLPIVYACNKGRGELPTRHLPSRSTSVCSFIVKCRTLSTLTEVHMRREGALALYGNTTLSDLKFMLSETEMYLDSLSSTSSTRSDAGSAPTDPVEILDKISTESSKWVDLSGRQLPPEWSMPDLVRAVIADDRIYNEGFLTFWYYDMMLQGQDAWLCEEILTFLDLINYVF